MNDYIIEVKDLGHTYRTHQKSEGLLGSLRDWIRRSSIHAQALQNISFQIRPGEIVGLLGPNGAGKTTLLKILSGLVLPSTGTALVINRTPHKKERSFLKQIGMVMGQKSQLLWDIPPIDTLNIIRELYEINKITFDHRLAEFVELLSIGQFLKIPVRTLSLGERMKFELVASLIHNPTLLFLDEPTIGLDIVSQRAIRDFLLEINRLHKTTIIITSHYMRDIEILAKRILIIKKGRILYDAALEELLKKFKDLQKIYFSTDASFQLALPYQTISPKNYAVTCCANDLQQIVAEIASRIAITSLRTEHTSLEDAIFSIFDDKQVP